MRHLRLVAGSLVFCITAALLSASTSAAGAAPLPTGVWTDRSVGQTPQGRQWAAVAYDETDQRAVLFGGFRSTSYSTSSLLGDTWTWNGSNWTEMQPTRQPVARFGAVATYDPNRGRVVLFGGTDLSGNGFADTWEWDGTTWVELFPATSPPARFHAASSYDTTAGRWLVYGGEGTGGATLGDTWAWDGTTWTEVTPPSGSPRPREGAKMAYDPIRNQTVLFGGWIAGGSGDIGDTWLWNGTQWTSTTATRPRWGLGYVQPASRGGMVYDPKRQGIVYYDGGAGLTGDTAGTWEWTGTAWQQRITVNQPPDAGEFTLFYDTTLERPTFFGGRGPNEPDAPGYPTGTWTLDPVTVPGPPQQVSATPGNQAATVTWSAPASDGGPPITGYTVTRSVVPLFPGQPVAPPVSVTFGWTATTQTITGLTNGVAYTFTVTATNSIGSGPASPASAAVTPRTVPGAPYLVSATPGNTSATVSWSPPTANGGTDGGSPITSYTVTAYAGANPINTVTATGTSATVTGLSNGVAYTFMVAATNAAGTGSATGAPSAVTPRTVPGTPTGVTAITAGNEAMVTWAAPADNGGSPITSYTVTAYAGENPVKTVTVTGSSAWSATVTGLANSTSYTFSVAATNGAGSGPAAWSSSVIAGFVPGGPTGVSATPGDSQAMVTWAAPADNGSSAIISYTVTAYDGANPIRTVTVAGTSATLTGLTNGIAYVFTVAATNTTGTGPPSALSTPAVPRTVPGTPTAVGGTVGDDQVTVTWTAPSDDGGAAIDSYTVTAYAGATMVTTVTATGTTATVTGLVNGTAYTFTVAATNAAGTGTQSAASSAVTPWAVPGAPLDVSGTPGNGQVTVTWSAPSDDGGPAISSYTVTAYSAGNPVKTVTVTTTSATVTELSNGTAYTFTVVATNAAGTGATSTASAAVTPTTVPAAPTSVSATAGNAQLGVSWSAPVDNGGSAITSYTVSVYSGATLVKTVGATGTGTPITGLTNGVAYTFTVAATNAAGTGPQSGASAPVAPVGPPGAARDVIATAGDAQATVSWSLPASNGGIAVSGYTINVLTGGTTVRTLTVYDTATSTTISGLTNETAYTFTVAARNTLGPGPDSAPSAAVTPSPPANTAPPVDTTPAGPTGPTATLRRSGYWMVASDGNVYAFGDAKSFGNAATASAVDLEPTPSGNGYWVVDDLGRVFAFGDAVGRGNVDRARLAVGEKATSLSATRSGNGYWIFTSWGRVLTFGDALFLGDVSGLTLAGPVLDSIPTPSGLGYYMVASDGGIFAFGDATFYGSMGGKKLNAPVQSLVPDADGAGYWLVAADGGIFAFQADFKGSMGAARLNKPVTGMVRSGSGYLMVGEDGGIFDFSGSTVGFKGSLGANPPAHPITSVAVLEDL